jgi:hypothetical protein
MLRMGEELLRADTFAHSKSKHMQHQVYICSQQEYTYATPSIHMLTGRLALPTVTYVTASTYAHSKTGIAYGQNLTAKDRLRLI